MENIITQIGIIVKLIGEKPMLELVKSWWIKFSIGFSIIGYFYMPLLTEIVKKN